MWVNPCNFLVKHNAGLVGSFSGGPLSEGYDTPDNLQFIPNPNYMPGAISPFHLGLIRNYQVEYELESIRYNSFKRYPSRLHALYLLESREAAEQYKEAHREHVKGRILKRGITCGNYKYSCHDAGWIDFLRQAFSLDEFSICANNYWRGEKITNPENQFIVQGNPWSGVSITEILYYGRLDFPDKQLFQDD